jgi:hypothetical protein
MLKKKIELGHARTMPDVQRFVEPAEGFSTMFAMRCKKNLTAKI